MSVEEIETDDAIGVYVWVHGYGVGVVFEEDNFRGLYRRSMISVGSRNVKVRRLGGGERRKCTSIGYCGLKLNFSLYVSP